MSEDTSVMADMIPHIPRAGGGKRKNGKNAAQRGSKERAGAHDPRSPSSPQVSGSQQFVL
ncbi:hypothetical protein GCM10010431_72150 [Streptomyces kunmingensis]